MRFITVTAALLATAATTTIDGAAEPLLKIAAVGDMVAISDSYGGGITIAYNTQDDEYRVFWHERTPSADITSRRVSVTGEPIDDKIVIADWTNANEFDTAAAYNPSANNYVVTWRRSTVPGSNPRICALVSATGGPITDETLTGLPGYSATLIYNRIENEFFGVAGSLFHIGGGRILADGTPLVGNPLSAANGPAGGVAHNTLTNQYLATWRDTDSRNLIGRFLNPDGSDASEDFEISDIYPEYGISAASVTYDPVRNRYLVVHSENFGGPVHSRLVGADGEILAGYVVAGSHARKFPGSAYHPTQDVHLVGWHDAGVSELGAQLIDGDGRNSGLRSATSLVVQDGYLVHPSIAANTGDGSFMLASTMGPAGVLVQRYEVFCAADIDTDRNVSKRDLLAVVDGWGSSGGPADANADGRIDILDLLLVVTAWGVCP